MGQHPSFQRMIDSCFSQNGYARFLAAFWSIRMSWRLGSWGGLCPRQWKVSFTVSVSQSTLGLPCLRYGGFLGMQVWFSKMTCRRGSFASARRMWPNRLIFLCLQKSEFLNIHSMRVCCLQYDLVGLRSIYESGWYFENSSQSLHLKSI